jgi:excisionase family DNA binding protein
MPSIRTYIQQKIREIESWVTSPSDETDWEQVALDCGSLLAEVERKATTAGVPEAVAACQVRGASISVRETRRILAVCLAACPADRNKFGAKFSAATNGTESAADTNGAMSVAEVAKRLGVSEGAIYERCRDGRLQCTRIGRRITISPEQLRSYQSELPTSVGLLRHLF